VRAFLTGLKHATLTLTLSRRTGRGNQTALALLLVVALLTGCSSSPKSSPTTAPIAFAASTNFDKLWDASADVAEDLKFTLERQDRRSGTLTTAPLTSAQAFEFWRGDVRTMDGLAESTLASVRRTLVIRIEPRTGVAGQQAYAAVPKVVVERQAQAEHRITNVAGFRQIYRRSDQFGTRESDQGILQQRSYWYEIGTDAALEQYVAEKIAARLR
jgi:hypothetical protein